MGLIRLNNFICTVIYKVIRLIRLNFLRLLLLMIEGLDAYASRVASSDATVGKKIDIQNINGYAVLIRVNDRKIIRNA